ncbi:MAG: hypothetical protein KJ645_09110, partial [Planctomycetes bacterium]|nr:hypothetical protein [Planctomycetota bacterium]
MPMPVETMQEFNIQEQIRRYLGLLGERWFLIAVCVIIMMLIGFGVAQLWPNSYESSTLFVLRSSRLVDDTAFEKAINPAAALAAKQRTMIGTIRSHARVEEVMRTLEWKEFIKAQMDPISLTEFFTKVGNAIQVEIIQDAVGDTQVELSFTWNDPNKAALFCETMRDVWIDKKLESYEKDYTDKLDIAEILLREQWDAYAQAKQDLEKFDNETQFSSLGTLDELNRLKTELIAQIDVNRGKVLSMGHSITDLENQLATIPQSIPQAKQVKNPEWVTAFANWKIAYSDYQKKQERLTEANSDLIKAREKVE